jgi:phage shock protein A
MENYVMKTLKRFTSTIVASFDRVVSQIENHEALVEAAIQDAQRASARASVHLRRVESDGRTMRRRLLDLQESAKLWERRAVHAADTERERALECMRRRKKVLEEFQSLEEQEREHAQLQKQLQSDLEKIHDRLRLLKQQRNLLKSRQSRAEALGAVNSAEPALFSEIDDLLDRWEVKVTEYELSADCDRITDDFEDVFVSQEEEGELERALNHLLTQTQPCIQDECTD